MAHPTVVINNITYADCPEVDIPKSGGGTAKFFDASQTDATAANVLSGKKFVGTSGEDTGTMANNGSTSGTISTKSGTVSISWSASARSTPRQTADTPSRQDLRGSRHRLRSAPRTASHSRPQRTIQSYHQAEPQRAEAVQHHTESMQRQGQSPGAI